MTLIAAFKIQGVPFLIGDLLITAPNDTSPHAPVPTLPNLDHILPREEYYPAVKGLRRKLVKINDWLVVGWAGHVVAARYVLKSLRDKFKAKRASREQVFSLLTQLESMGEVYCELTGWTIDKEGLVGFSWSSITNKLEMGDGPHIKGTGSEDFVKYFNAFETGGIKVWQSTTGDPVRLAIGFTGDILGRELVNGETIEALYGGGMDMFYLENGKFREVDDITYLFWLALFDNEKYRVEIRPIIIKIYYKEGVLVIKTTRLVYSSEMNADIVDSVEMFALYSPDTLLKPTKFPMKTSNSRYYCNFFFTPLDNKMGMMNTIVAENANGDTFIEFKPTPGIEGVSERIYVSDKFRQQALSFLVQQYRNPPPM